MGILMTLAAVTVVQVAATITAVAGSVTAVAVSAKAILDFEEARKKRLKKLNEKTDD